MTSSNLWPGHNLHVLRHDVVLCEVNWRRIVTLFKRNWKLIVLAPESDIKLITA